MCKVDISVKRYQLNNVKMTLPQERGDILLLGTKQLFIVGPGINLENAYLGLLENYIGAEIKLDISTHNLLDVSYRSSNVKKNLFLPGVKLLLPKGYVIIDGCLLGPGVNSPNLKLTATNIGINEWSGKFQNLAKITGEVMRSPLDSKGKTRIDLSYANLEGSDFTGLPSQWFKGVRYYKTNLKKCKFGDIDFHHQNTNKKGATDQDNFRDCDITDADFSKAKNLHQMERVIVTNGRDPAEGNPNYKLESINPSKNYHKFTRIKKI